ncbi:MAG: hypothetical protein JSV06_04725, partial [Myxococcales bacterium]
MIRASAWCVVALLALGCESGEEPTRGANPGLELILYEAKEKPPREPADAPRPDPPADVPDLLGEGEEKKEERDLEEELKARLGVPVDCIRDFTAPRPTTIRVSIAATVRPTGMVISPSVYGTGLSMAARQCIQRRVETVV